MARNKRWFQQAIHAKKPTGLAGWQKGQSATARRRRALSSRPKNWPLRRRRRSAGQALQSLSNVTRDKVTKKRAKQDADYFFGQLKKMGPPPSKKRKRR